MESTSAFLHYKKIFIKSEDNSPKPPKPQTMFKQQIQNLKVWCRPRSPPIKPDKFSHSGHGNFLRKIWHVVQCINNTLKFFIAHLNIPGLFLKTQSSYLLISKHFIVLEFCHSHLFSEHWKSPVKCSGSIREYRSTVSSSNWDGLLHAYRSFRLTFHSACFCENTLYIHLFIASELIDISHILFYFLLPSFI